MRVNWDNNHARANRFNCGMRASNPFARLLAEGTMVGRDLAVTNVRTGTRKSIFNSVTSSLTTNAADVLTAEGLYAYGAMNGATNLADTDLTAVGWAKLGSSAVESDNVFTITQPASSSFIRYAISVTAGADYTLTFMAKRGTATELNTRIYDNDNTSWLSFSLNGATASSAAQDYYPLLNSTDYTSVNVSFTAPANSTTVYLNINYTSSSAGTSFIKDVRAVASAVAHAAFADGSAAAAAYGTDLYSCSPSWGAAGTIVQAAVPYGYSGAGNPNSASARLFAATDYNVAGTANLTLTGSGGAPTISSGVAVSDGAVNILSSDWDGVNIGLRVNGGSRNQSAEATPPSSTLYIGNVVAGNLIFHGALVTLIFNRVLTDAEYEVLRVGLNDRLSGVTYR